MVQKKPSSKLTVYSRATNRGSTSNLTKHYYLVLMYQGPGTVDNGDNRIQNRKCGSPQVNTTSQLLRGSLLITSWLLVCSLFLIFLM